MFINSILFIFILLFAVLFILFFITLNIYYFLSAVLLLIGVISWYCLNLLKGKSKGIPAESRLFRGFLEVHLGKQAMKNPAKFITLFIDSILWAKNNNIDKAVFFTWYSSKESFEKYFKGKVEISKPNLFHRISNIYLNKSYWFHKTGKEHMKVVVKIDQLTLLEIKELKQRRDRLIKRSNK